MDMKIVFRAQDEAHVEKLEIFPHQDAPEGYYNSRAEALENWKPAKKKSDKE